MDDFYQTVESAEELEQLQGTPGRLANHKVINFLDEHCLQFIHLSPFVVMSTSDSEGKCDSSPKGDHSGFVHVLDDRHLLLPERMGNRRMDSLRNLLENSGIGLIFMIPGLKETLRINGQAAIVKDASLMQQLEANGHIPNVAILVKVEECFIHCAKAFIRSKLWSPDHWPDTSTLPSPAKMMADHTKLKDLNEADVQASFHESYTQRLY